MWRCAQAREAQLKNFFQNVEVACRGVNQTSTAARWEVRSEPIAVGRRRQGGRTGMRTAGGRD
eukprot:356541-Chlamydomonas_euryale.AAC.6